MGETDKNCDKLTVGPPVVDLFIGHPNFIQFSEAELKIFSSYCKNKSLNDGDVLIQDGEHGESMFIVKRGGVKILKMGFLGETAIAKVNPGEFVGEMAVIDFSPRSATAKVTGTTELLELSRDNFEKLKKEHPQIGIKLMDLLLRLLSLRLRNTTARMLKK